MTKHTRRTFLRNSATGIAALPLLRTPQSKAAAGTAKKMSMGEPKFVDVDGIRTRYFEGGSGEAILLVHGGHFGMAGAADGWMPVFPHLARHFHVYAIDKLGMGFTDNPRNDADYSMQATVRHVYRFLQVMGVQQAHVAGHSRGGLPVARIAIDHPEMVRTLIVFDSNTLAPGDPAPSAPDLPPSASGPPPTKESIRQELMASRSSYHKEYITDEYVEAQLQAALLPKVREAAQKLELLRSRFIEKNPEKVKARPALAHNSGTGWWMYQVKDETLDAIKGGRLKTPTLIVWGFNDPSAPYKLGVDLLEQISKSVNRAELHVFNRSGHAPYAEYPKEVTDLVANFVAATRLDSKSSAP